MPFRNDPVGSPLQSPLAAEIIIIKTLFKMHSKKQPECCYIVNINHALYGTVSNTLGHQSIALEIPPQKTSSTTEISLRGHSETSNI